MWFMDTVTYPTRTADCAQNPQWMPPPPNGHRCRITGLTHGRFYQLLAAAGDRIRTVSLKDKGKTRGTRLVHVPSLLGYLDSLPSVAASATKGGTK